MGGNLQRRVLLPAIGEVGARDPGGEFGAQGQRFIAAIAEGIHLLRHHIGGFADGAAEHFGLLEHRHFHAAEAVKLAHPFKGFHHMGESFRLGPENVLRATDRVWRFHLAHGTRL